MINAYSWPTPNGHKVHIMLEKCGLRLGRDWQVFPINIGAGDQFKPEFLAISPNNKIPALIKSAAGMIDRQGGIELQKRIRHFCL